MPSSKEMSHDYEARDLWRGILGEIRPHFRGICLATILGIVVAAISLIQPRVVGRIVNSAADGIDIRLVFAFALGLTLGAVFSALEQYILERISESMVYGIRIKLARRVLGANLKRIEAVESGNLTSALGSDTAQLRGILSQGVVELLVQSLTLLGALIMMLYIDWVLFLVVVMAVIFLLLSGVLLGTRTRPAAEQVQSAVAAMSAHFGRVLSGVRTVKAFRGEPTFLNAIRDSAEAARVSGFRVAKLKAVVAGFTQSAIQILLFVVIGVGAIRVSSGEMSVGDLTSFIMYVMLVFTPAAMLGGVVSAISEGLGAYARVARFSSWESENVEGLTVRSSIDVDSSAIGFDGVYLSYEDCDNDNANTERKWALAGFSIRVPRGAFAAFVGRSGAGKSTIFNILEKFYLPERGTASVFGCDIATIDPATLRENFAFVDQNAPVFAGTVRENLAFVRPRATDEDILRAIKSARFIVNGQVPDLSMVLGEGGLGISGGERQRLALARAFLSDAPIILLDEATSNLDSITEQEVHASLFELRRQRTVLAIAHRLATVSSADVIYVLDDGRLIDHGTHLELLARCDIYRELVESQQLQG